jgi:FtsP/CotA-like multicopper oxidase with cupredoxin domain
VLYTNASASTSKAAEQQRTSLCERQMFEMAQLTDPQRREFLRSALATATLAATASGLSVSGCMPSDSAFVPDLHIELRATKDEAQIRPGQPTHVWRYRGKVIKGDLRALEFLGYLPLLRVRRGQKVRIDLINDLSEPTIVHWHGLYVPAAMDGHPRHAIGRGKRHVYEFEVRNRAGTYWFHPHPHGRTGKQVYFGMAGLLIVSDDEESAAGLPDGDYDIPLIIQDRRFDNDNQLIYLPGSDSNGMMGEGMMGGGMMGGGAMMGRGMMGDMGPMMAGMMGFLGDRVLVNGKPDFVLPVEARAYRLRLLNGSNTRIYKLAWSDGSPVTVVGTDGGLLEKPLTRPYVMLSPAERVDVWADFSSQPIGAELTLHSLSVEGDMAMGGMMDGGMMQSMMGSMTGDLPNGAPFPILKARVERRSTANVALPRQLSTIPAARPQDTVNFRAPKVFNITMGMMVWGINGRSFEMEGVTADETVRLDTAEIWEFRNDAETGMMGMMAHAMHVHGLQFRVLERSVEPRFSSGRNSVSAGYVDVGWKDTVLVMPGERVRMLLRFEHYDGLYLYHCHMLEHEDSGLMRNYLVEA